MPGDIADDWCRSGLQFGLSKDEEKQSISQSSCGTPEYVAPEILRCGLGECYSGKVRD